LVEPARSALRLVDDLTMASTGLCLAGWTASASVSRSLAEIGSAAALASVAALDAALAAGGQLVVPAPCGARAISG
jgi:hypothetical protein